MTQTPSPALEPPEPAGPGADAVDQEVEPDAAGAGPVSATENARGRYGRPPRRPSLLAVASM